jgi:hypothetical protein
MRHKSGGVAYDVLGVGVQKNANSSCDHLGGNQVYRKIAIQDEKPVDQFRIVRKSPFHITD